MPTDPMKAGDFNGSGKTVRDPFNNNSPFPGNVIPRNRFDSIANQMLQYFPTANFIGVRPGVNFLQTPGDRERRDQYTGRIDHRVSSKGNLFGRYTMADNELANVAYIIGKGLIRPDNTHNIALGYTHLFSSTVIGETRLGFTRAFLARQRVRHGFPNLPLPASYLYEQTAGGCKAIASPILECYQEVAG